MKLGWTTRIRKWLSRPTNDQIALASLTKYVAKLQDEKARLQMQRDGLLQAAHGAIEAFGHEESSNPTRQAFENLRAAIYRANQEA